MLSRFPECRFLCIRRPATNAFNCIPHGLNRPPLRHHTKFGLFEAVGEQGCNLGCQTSRLLTTSTCMNRIEVNKPRLEQRLQNTLQRNIRFTQKFNF